MAGATSLVQLILKKWGDDIAGAAKELEEKVGFPESVANRIATGELPMDEASRMARAAEQGYDTSRPVYHGTDTDFLEFDPDRAIGSQFWSTTDKAAVERGDVGAAGHGVIKELYHNIQNPAGWDEYDKLLLDEISGRGHDGLKLSDPDGHATMVAFDPKQYKSTDAAFDPEYTGSNIMGGLALPVAAGLLAAGQSEYADASEPTTAEERGFRSWDSYRDPTAPLPPPTWGEAMGKAADNLFTVLDAPLTGLQGLSRVGYGLLSGESFDEAMNHGADVVNGGVEAGAERFGDYTLRKTDSPEAATLAHVLALMASPI